jgi:uncharacterized membrane protein YhaH (DUF805 family)
LSRKGLFVSFAGAISDGFSQYATFSGRSRRRAYWFWVLFVFLVSVVTTLVDPSIAVTVRRLHDTGRSGWWWWLSFLCGIGAIIVLIFCLIDSSPGANEYGPNPKGA